MESTGLLIVDVQVGAFDGIKTPSLKNGNQLIENISNLIRLYRSENLPVIYIQDCGDIGGAFEKGTDHWQICPNISPEKKDIVIPKTTSNAFFQTSLKETIHRLGIETLVVCGLHSEGCFSSTCFEALSLGIKTIVVADGHSTAQEKYTEVIEHTNSEMKLRGASIKRTADLLSWK